MNKPLLAVAILLAFASAHAAQTGNSGRATFGNVDVSLFAGPGNRCKPRWNEAFMSTTVPTTTTSWGCWRQMESTIMVEWDNGEREVLNANQFRWERE